MKNLLIYIFFILCTVTYCDTDITRTINIQGSSEISVAPDTFTIVASAETINTDLSKSVNDNNKIIKKAVSNLIEAGIKERDIKTGSYSLEHRIEKTSPEYQGVRKYFVKNQIIITSDNINISGKIITALENAGINNIQGINFSSSKRNIYEKEALIMAYKDAKEKAEAIASLEGYILIPITISSNVYFPRGINYMVQAEGYKVAEAAPIYAPETIDIRGNVSASFQLKNKGD